MIEKRYNNLFSNQNYFFLHLLYSSTMYKHLPNLDKNSEKYPQNHFAEVLSFFLFLHHG